MYNVVVNAILGANLQITDPNVAPPPEFNCPTLRTGTTGPAVTALQGLLKDAGFGPGAIDGIFGTRTQASVIAFQRSKNLVPDGVVGIQTWTTLGVSCKIP